MADSGNCQLLHTPAADIKLKHILSIGWKDLLHPCTTRSLCCRHQHNLTSTKMVESICMSHPILKASPHMTDSKISVSKTSCDKHIAQHTPRSFPVSNAALKKRHSDTLTFTPSCLCLTLNCEKCCSANFQVQQKNFENPWHKFCNTWDQHAKTSDDKCLPLRSVCLATKWMAGRVCSAENGLGWSTGDHWAAGILTLTVQRCLHLKLSQLAWFHKASLQIEAGDTQPSIKAILVQHMSCECIRRTCDAWCYQKLEHGTCS